MGRPILIREDRGDGGNHGRGVGGGAGARVFVGNLSWQVAWQDLKDHMRAVSAILLYTPWSDVLQKTFLLL